MSFRLPWSLSVAFFLEKTGQSALRINRVSDAGGDVISAQNHKAIIDAIPDDDFPLMLRMQLESADFADLPGDLQAALAERAARMGLSSLLPTKTQP